TMVIYIEHTGSCCIAFRAGAIRRDATVSDAGRPDFNLRSGVVSNYRVAADHDRLRQALAIHLSYRPAGSIHRLYRAGVTTKYSLSNRVDLEDARAGTPS